MRKVKKMLRKRHKGAATLVLTTVLMTLATLLIIFAANYGKLQSKSIANINRNQQAFEAAEAGLEFGINYLNTNNSTILASPSGGYIQPFSNSSVTNVALANGSQFSITYINPVANDYELIRITSVGTSDDATSTHTVSQLVKFGSMLLNAPTVPLISKSEISLGGNSQIINTYNSSTVQAGGTVDMSGSSSTILSSGTSSTAGNIQSDVQQNISSLSSMSDNDFFNSFFGLSPNGIKSGVTHYYENSSNANYGSDLSGKEGTSIWIEQTGGTATLNGNVTIGSTSNPVLLIVNGDIRFTGNVTIYGYIYVLGTSSTDLSGNVMVIGGMATTNELNATGSIQVVFSPTVLDNLQNNGTMRYYAKVPGSWKDF